MAHILVFGTSTTYGAWDIEDGWVQRLRKFLDEKIITSNYAHSHLVYNLGVSGDKTDEVLKRFEQETKARIDNNEETIFLFQTGINDTIFNQKISNPERSPRQFEANLTQLILLAKKYSKKIIVIGSMPVDTRVDPIPWSPGRSYKDKYVAEFNKIMKKVSNKNKVHFIEIYQEFIKKDYTKLLADGVHMTSEGHKQFFEIVKNYLIENKIL
ncbi:MAG: GDSL-type esterase/lipase family protein [Candidatus Levybacteria bacterium]|nr:GDSL-type esterase/lipase family protein [Candidatus Levybacteria bacterium]